MEFSLGKQAFETGANVLNTELSKVNYQKLRRYFDVSSSYVVEKLFLIIFPFKSNNLPADSSVYRPDLYIPLMSFVTLIILKGFLLGLKNNFHPEVLCYSFSRILIIHIGMNLLYKGVAYLLDAKLHFREVLCYTGYRFFVLVLIRILKQIYIGKLLSVYFYVSYFFFLSRSLKTTIVQEYTSKKQIYMLFGISGMEMLMLFLMS